MKRNKNSFKNQVLLAMSLLVGVLAVFLAAPQPTYAASPGCYVGSGSPDRPTYTKVNCSNPELSTGVTRGNQCYLIVSGAGTSTAVGTIINCDGFEVGTNSASSSSVRAEDVCPNPGTSEYVSCIADFEQNADNSGEGGSGFSSSPSTVADAELNVVNPDRPGSLSNSCTSLTQAEKEALTQGDPCFSLVTVEFTGDYQCGRGDKAIGTAINIGCRGERYPGTGPVNPIVDMMFALFRVLSAGVGLVVIGSIVFAGIQYSASRGNPQMTQVAITRVTNSVIGLLLYIFMYALANFLVPGGILL